VTKTSLNSEEKQVDAPRLSFKQYAEHRGVSQAAVSQALRKGRITARVDENGVRYVLAAEADAQWTQRSEPIPSMKPLATPVTQSRIRAPSVIPNRITDDDDESEEDLIDAGGGEMIPALYVSKAKKEYYVAQAVELKHQVELGKVVPAEEVGKRWSKIVATARTKILGIPSKTRQRAPEMTNEVYLELEKVVREALEDLANDAD
jgi:hypothetical protein